jgi:putative zinc finger protein
MTDPAGMRCHEARMSLGVLVLGAIEPEERPVLETHLAGCSSCSAELAQLAVLPGLLQRLDPDLRAAGMGVGAAPGFGARLRSAGSDLAAQRRRQARRRGVAAVAGLAAASAAVAVLVVGRSPQGTAPDGSGRTVVATSSRPGNPVAARFVLRPRSGGTLVSVSLHGVGPRQRCSLVAVGLSGRREVAASWVASYTGTATVEGTTSLSIADIARLLVVGSDGTPLARTGPLHPG